MKYFIFLTLLTYYALASRDAKIIIPMELICKDNPECLKALKSSHIEYITPSKKKWNIRVEFSAHRIFYSNTDIHFKLNNNSNFTVQDQSIKERHSLEFYKFWNAPSVGKAFQFIDEPSNNISISFEKNGHQLIINYFHPKYILSWVWDADEYNNPEVLIEGNHLDHEFSEVSKLGNGNETNPRLPSFPELRNTFKHFQLSLGYGKNIPLARSRKLRLSYNPQLLVGVHLGNSFANYTQGQGGETLSISGFNDKVTQQGYAINLTNIIRISGKNDRLGFHFKHILNHSRKDYEILNGFGNISHHLNYHSLGLGINYRFGK